jgi:hypothetical protein
MTIPITLRGVKCTRRPPPTVAYASRPGRTVRATAMMGDCCGAAYAAGRRRLRDIRYRRAARRGRAAPAWWLRRVPRRARGAGPSGPIGGGAGPASLPFQQKIHPLGTNVARPLSDGEQSLGRRVGDRCAADVEPSGRCAPTHTFTTGSVSDAITTLCRGAECGGATRPRVVRTSPDGRGTRERIGLTPVKVRTGFLMHHEVGVVKSAWSKGRGPTAEMPRWPEGAKRRATRSCKLGSAH